MSEGGQEAFAVDGVEVELEQELDALVGSRQNTRRTDDDEQQQKQRGHQQLRGSLNAVAHAVLYNKIGDAQNDDRPEDGLHGVARELGKVGLEVFGVALHLAYE